MSLLIGDLGSVTGPFFLGYMMEAFGMGVVLVLAADYLLSVASRSRGPSEGSRMAGVALVAVMLTITMAQTTLDTYRGFRMFGTNFLNVSQFVQADSLFFWSPFLGILSAIIAQLFLLRRIVRFLSSLELLWPFLSRRWLRYTFVGSMLSAMLLAAVAGCKASATVAGTGGLASLALGNAGAEEFQIFSAMWLGTAVGVDCVLCSILCVELWWARRKLSMKGTNMQEFMTRLILVTFHGGAAVTGLQVATLLLYYYQRVSSWCYFPMILLPKIYSITLILSISLPQSTTIKSPSAMISLPTIQPDLTDLNVDLSRGFSTLPTPTSQPLSYDRGVRAISRHIHFKSGTGSQAIEGKEGQVQSAPHIGTRWSQVFRTSWRQSQGLLSWSLVPGAGSDGRVEIREAREKKVVWSKKDIEGDGSVFPPYLPRPVSAPHPRRASLMPLLNAPSPTSAGVPFTANTIESNSPRSAEISSDSPLARAVTNPIPHSARRERFSTSISSTLRTRRDSFPTLFPTAPTPDLFPISYPLPAYASPPQRDSTSTSASSRRQSIPNDNSWPATARATRRSITTLYDLHTSSHRPHASPSPLQATHQESRGFQFDTINPFESVYSSGRDSQGSLIPPGTRSRSKVYPPNQRSGFQGVETSSADRSLRVSSVNKDDEDDADDLELERPMMRERGRNMSFQDFLDDPDSNGPPDKRKNRVREGMGKW